jgi:hypothetical protein
VAFPAQSSGQKKEGNGTGNVRSGIGSEIAGMGIENENVRLGKLQALMLGR